MRHRFRPRLTTTGIAIAGAGLIVVPPIAPPAPDIASVAVAAAGTLLNLSDLFGLGGDLTS